MIGKMFSALLVASMAALATYTLAASEPCARVVRMSLPLQMSTDSLAWAVKPWSPDIHLYVRYYGLKAILRFQKIARHQFYPASTRCYFDEVSL